MSLKDKRKTSCNICGATEIKPRYLEEDVLETVGEIKHRISFVINTIRGDIGESRSSILDDILLNRMEGFELCIEVIDDAFGFERRDK